MSKSLLQGNTKKGFFDMIYPKSAQPQMNSMHHNFNYGILHVQSCTHTIVGNDTNVLYVTNVCLKMYYDNYEMFMHYCNS